MTSNPAHANDAIKFGTIDRDVYALYARYGKVPGAPTVEDGVSHTSAPGTTTSTR